MRSTQLTFTKPNRYGASKITIVDDMATIKIDVNKSGLIGCRMVASGLDLLVEGCGGVDRIPDCIQFASDTHKFAERAQDTVNLLSNTSKRREFIRNYSYLHVPVMLGEEWREYENRAPKVAKEAYAEYSWLDRTSIRVGGSQGVPDAIFVHDASKRLVIVEAKMRAKSFVEGTAQLMCIR